MSTSSSVLPMAAAVVLPAVSVTSSVSSLVEGNRGSQTVTFTITLDTVLLTDETVDWTIAGSGTDPADDSDLTSTLSGTLSFTAGTTSLTVSVTVAADSIWEEDEDFTFTLSTPSANIMLGTSTATVTIANDDPQLDDYDDVIGNNERLIVNGGPVDGTINYGNDNDVFEFNVVSGQTYTVDMKATGSLNAFLEIWDADGNVIAYNDDANDSTSDASLTFTATSSGTIYFSAWSYSFSETGDYTIEVTSPSLLNVMDGSIYADNIIGTFLDDIITGYSGKDSIFGNYGNDQIFADEGNDRINGGADDDVIYTGAGNDKVIFQDNAGHDEIADFEQGHDRINLIKTSIKNFADLTANHLTDTDEGARISWGNSSVLLVGVEADLLKADDFLF